MSTASNHDLADPIFRDGRWITVGAVVGSLLITAGCFGGYLTAFEMNESDWVSKVRWRFGFVFLLFFAGFISIIASILRPMRMLIISGLLAAVASFAIAYFPSGAQMVSGPETCVGTIQSIVVPHAIIKARVKPMSGTVSTGLTQPKAIVTLLLDTGEEKTLKLNCRDLLKHLGGDIQSLSQPKIGEWKIVHLPLLNRVLTLRQD